MALQSTSLFKSCGTPIVHIIKAHTTVLERSCPNVHNPPLFHSPFAVTVILALKEGRNDYAESENHSLHKGGKSKPL